MKNINCITFNWFFSVTDNVENYEERIVGQKGVASISLDETYDRPHYVVDYDDGRSELVYNPNRVFLNPAAPEESTYPIDFPF